MFCTTRGIVLHSIPYKDTSAIIYMYTEAFGRASYMVSRRRSKKSPLVKSLFIPLSVLDLEVEHLNKREIHRIKEARVCLPLQEILCDPIKNVLALFLSEFLFRVVKETEPDPRLFCFLYDSIQVLECADKGVANFHLVFLLRLLRYLGIFPNIENRRAGYYFDMLNSVFTVDQPAHPHFLGKEDTEVFARLLKMSYENMSLYVFSRQERVRIIQKILEYYHLHLPDFAEIKSLAVLQSLFDAG
ncbi:MAG TPA: DNA repair protein RecO [Candidatus Parabacteroides intestinavium]|nr:DNA repair protein RecO [Candidatus Parabacteroides intestinavium]